MFSALKRLTTTKTENGIVPGISPGHHAMSHNLQRKFAKGVQYNMKIVIRGDRNTGKTCLFHRLQGQKFIQEYMPTEEIQVASIQWSYKAADDVVKVEVWDVVDRGKKRAPIEGLKTGAEPQQAPALDAEFLDVYKAANGVILVMDITKNWTFDYIERELPNVPNHIPVLVLANHCDMSHHRTVTPDRVTYFIESIQRPAGEAQIRYTEASMSNGFGLKYVHKFFCLPFLQLQRESLYNQLERNRREAEITIQELDVYQQSHDANYDQFLENLTARRRQVAENHSASTPSLAPLSHSGSQQPTAGGDHHRIPRPQPPNGPGRSQSTPDIIRQALTPQPHPHKQAPHPQPHPPSLHPPAAAKLLSKPCEQPGHEKQLGLTLVDALDASVTSVEEFVPDGGELDRSFLEDSQAQQHGKMAESPDSESEVESANPLVAGFQDELDPDDASPLNESVDPPPVLPPLIAQGVRSGSEFTTRAVIHHRSPSPPPAIPQIAIPVEDLSSLPQAITGEALDEWLGSGMAGRVSPEGGEDSGPGGNDSGDSSARLQIRKPAGEVEEKPSRTKHHKKKSSKMKEEKKVRKKKSSSRQSGADELEEFLNSHDAAYDAL